MNVWDMGLNGDIEYIVARSLVTPTVAFGMGVYNGQRYFASIRNFGGDQGWRVDSRFPVTCHFPCGFAVEPDT